MCWKVAFLVLIYLQRRVCSSSAKAKTHWLIFPHLNLHHIREKWAPPKITSPQNHLQKYKALKKKRKNSKNKTNVTGKLQEKFPLKRHQVSKWLLGVKEKTKMKANASLGDIKITKLSWTTPQNTSKAYLQQKSMAENKKGKRVQNKHHRTYVKIELPWPFKNQLHDFTRLQARTWPVSLSTE